MAAIKSIKVGETVYDLKATYDGSAGLGYFDSSNGVSNANSFVGFRTLNRVS